MAYQPPHDPQRNLEALETLEQLLRDPKATARLSEVLSPYTARNLTRAIECVQRESVQAGVEALDPELRLVALQYGLPFVGFGFVDNAVMILAGDYIDLTLGISLGISSMAAAGIGNTISDVAGLGLGGVVEDLCARVGLQAPLLTLEQQRLKQTRAAKMMGSVIGVTVGCILGMSPLLFLETRQEHEAAME
ncbi:TPA: hypothetical protein N0F65_006763 [Lagenidium giganteum]|uniref:Transmembrane protein 65 n=1 Tax=Lagenidium giganteum TaxID=4803 RepID=A0AAV2YWN2_9STRA|nr:TPA: hypothetical protein N0F65_006763 [Lagenidium giganteum]